MVSVSVASSRTTLRPFDFAQDRQAPHATALDKQGDKRGGRRGLLTPA